MYPYIPYTCWLINISSFVAETDTLLTMCSCSASSSQPY